jgi:AraC-type DNA-binding domain-containing proteins
MQNRIKKHQVQHPLLQKYIKFFWELHIDHIELNHRLIPQRNINMRINLSDTPHSVCRGNDEKLLEDVYFLGLQNKNTNAQLKLNGRVDVMGICFRPYGMFPFLKMPVSEFSNQLYGADEVGFKIAPRVRERLQAISGTACRLAILEEELLSVMDDSMQSLDKFQPIFKVLETEKPLQLNDFSQRNNIHIRQIERLYTKYIGLPHSSYTSLNRIHCALNQLLRAEHNKLSDIAFDNDYFDQTHFINEFKRYTGDTPKSFIRQQNSILQIGKLS